jgi:hypothetical protein
VARAGTKEEVELWVTKAALEHLKVPLYDLACCGCG